MERQRYLKVQRKLCPHCNKDVSMKTFKSHKRKFYDADSKRWLIKESFRNNLNCEEDNIKLPPALPAFEDDSQEISSCLSDDVPPLPLPRDRDESLEISPMEFSYSTS